MSYLVESRFGITGVLSLITDELPWDFHTVSISGIHRALKVPLILRSHLVCK